MSSSAFRCTASMPASVFTSTTKNAVVTATTTFDSMPKPNQITMTGASTTMGMTWKTTMNGYITRRTSGM